MERRRRIIHEKQENNFTVIRLIDLLDSDIEAVKLLRKFNVIKEEVCGNENKSCKNNKMTIVKTNWKPGCKFKCNTCKNSRSILKGTAFEGAKHYLLGELILILHFFSCRATNLTEIKAQLDFFVGVKHKKESVNRVIKAIRSKIAEYVEKRVYEPNLPVVNAKEFAIIDESVLHTANNKTFWVVGVINSRTKNYRVAEIPNRSAWAIYQAIKDWIAPGAYLATDGYIAYKSIAKKLKAESHFVYRHRHKKFGKGLKSTSHIEGLWGRLKTLTFERYRCFPTYNTFSFLREAEFRDRFLTKDVSQRFEATLKALS